MESRCDSIPMKLLAILSWSEFTGGERALDQRAAAAVLRLARGLELRVGIHLGMGRQIAAVVPQVAPDAQDAFQRLAPPLRREGLEGDRPLVVGLDEGPEHARQIDRARAEVAPVRIPGV